MVMFKEKAADKAAPYLLFWTVVKAQVVCNHTLPLMIALGLSWDLWKVGIVPSTLLGCISGGFIAGIKTG